MAAYAFSRMKFRGRQAMMIAILAVLMLPAVATLAPLFVIPEPGPDRRRSTCAPRSSGWPWR